MSSPGMNCPLDGTALVMSERQGIEIDYCPSCRGVWLDRGELDKIIERASGDFAPAAAPAFQPGPQPAAPWSQDRHRGHDNRGDQRGGKRRKNFFEELFD